MGLPWHKRRIRGTVFIFCKHSCCSLCSFHIQAQPRHYSNEKEREREEDRCCVLIKQLLEKTTQCWSQEMSLDTRCCVLCHMPVSLHAHEPRKWSQEASYKSSANWKPQEGRLWASKAKVGSTSCRLNNLSPRKGSVTKWLGCEHIIGRTRRELRIGACKAMRSQKGACRGMGPCHSLMSL